MRTRSMQRLESFEHLHFHPLLPGDGLAGGTRPSSERPNPPMVV